MIIHPRITKDGEKERDLFSLEKLLYRQLCFSDRVCEYQIKPFHRTLRCVNEPPSPVRESVKWSKSHGPASLGEKERSPVSQVYNSPRRGFMLVLCGRSDALRSDGTAEFRGKDQSSSSRVGGIRKPHRWISGWAYERIG